MAARMIMKEATGEDALLKKPERRKQFRRNYGAAGDLRFLSGRPVTRRMEALEDLAGAVSERARFDAEQKATQRAAKEANEASKEAGRAEREEEKKRKREESAAKGPTAYKKLKELGLQSLKRWEMESIALHYFDHELAAKNKDGANTKNAERRAELQELMRDKAHMLPQPPRAKRARKTPAHLVDEYHSIGILS